MLQVNGKIVSVEKGNMEASAEEVLRRVCAFVVDNGSWKTKVICKGEQAEIIWANFLANGSSIDKSVEEGQSSVIERAVTVDFVVEAIREIRQNVLIVDCPEQIKFSYEFVVRPR